MNNNYYNISYSRLVLLLLPTMLRKSLIVALLTALVRPLTLIHGKFDAYRIQVDTSVNSQVCYMQSALNDTYDYYERRIIVRDAPINYADFFLYDEGSGNAVMVSDASSGNASLWVDAGKLGAIVPDFEVVFPKGYSIGDSEEKALRSFINSNKLASKKYTIVYE